MSEQLIDYPCAVADSSEEGHFAALEWLNEYIEPGAMLDLWVPLKRVLKDNSFLARLIKTQSVNIITPRDGACNVNGPVLAMYPSANELALITSLKGITALVIVEWSDNLDTWAKEVDADIIRTSETHKNDNFAFLEVEEESELKPEVIEGLQYITQNINHNNVIAASGYERNITISKLLDLYEDGYVLPVKRMLQWAAAHGWSGENSKELGILVRKISSGVKPRITRY